MTDEQLRAELVRVRAELDRRIAAIDAELAEIRGTLAAREASDLQAKQAWDDAMDRMYGRPRRRHLRLVAR